MPTKLSTTIKKIEAVPNRNNARLILEFHKFMQSNGSSERHQNNNLKAIISYAIYLGSGANFSNLNTSQEILSFLDTKIKTKEEDPDQKWITTWNDYLHRIKHFLRWLHNNTFGPIQNLPMENWITLAFLQIKEKRTPNLETTQDYSEENVKQIVHEVLQELKQKNFGNRKQP
jgi:integrase/recombinase XerD